MLYLYSNFAYISLPIIVGNKDQLWTDKAQEEHSDTPHTDGTFTLEHDERELWLLGLETNLEH